MAGKKESTRQKMINLMYLVFIAMLALNISKEVLGTLGILTEDIKLSNTEIQKQITLGYAKIDEGNKQAGDRYTAAFQEKDNLKSTTGDFYNYLQNIIDLLQKDENGNLDESLRKTIEVNGETITRWDYQLMTKGKELQDYFFLKPWIESKDGVVINATENGAKFIELYSSFQENINKVLDSINSKNERNSVKPFEFDLIKDDLKSRFPFSDDGTVMDRDGDKIPYLEYHFDGFPLIASISKLTNMQANILAIENRILKAITEGIAVDEMALTNYETNIYSDTSFITGSSIDAKIVLGRNDDNFIPNDAKLFANGQELRKDIDYSFEQGGVKLTKTFTSAGVYSLTGTLYFNQSDSVAVDQKINVQNAPNSAIVSSDAMKVMYRGLRNPITIGFPGVNESSISVSATGAQLTRISGLNYTVIPSESDKVNIIVSGNIDGRNVVDNNNEYEVKDGPPAEGSVRLTFGGETYVYTQEKGEGFSRNIPKSALLRGTVTGVKPAWFNYNYTIEVSRFSVKVGNLPPVEINGNQIGNNATLRRTINSANAGTDITINVLSAEKNDSGYVTTQEVGSMYLILQ
jgi:gliding motility-associated protein GldM